MESKNFVKRFITHAVCVWSSGGYYISNENLDFLAELIGPFDSPEEAWTGVEKILSEKIYLLLQH